MNRNEESPVDPAELHASFLRSVLSLEPSEGPWHRSGGPAHDESAPPPAARAQPGRRRRRARGSEGETKQP